MVDIERHCSAVVVVAVVAVAVVVVVVVMQHEPPHDKTIKCHVCSAKAQISLGVRPV